MIRDKFNKNKIELQLDLPQIADIDCRETQISQAVMNLFNNAIDAANDLYPVGKDGEVVGIANFEKNPKWIRLAVIQNPESVEISVTDCGKGIPPAVAEKMMLPFFTTKEIGKGTGLGLSNTEGMARQHRGSLKYEVRNGNTCFILTLPNKQPDVGFVNSNEPIITDTRPGGFTGASDAA